MVNLGIAPYILSKLVILAPLLTVLLIVMVTILRLTGRLPVAGVDVYWRLMLTLVLTGFVGLALALLTSAFVSTPQQATDMLSVWIMPQVLFGGALLSVTKMNVTGQIFSAFQPVRWSFEGLGHIVGLNTLFRVDTSQIGPGLAIEYGDSFSRNPLQNWIILVVFIIVPLVLTYFVLRRRTTAA
jgi:ABC-type transport system involved in multi-copper enzyme maturation permease subunit